MIGKKLGAYEVVAKLGQGGMGEVYRARDPRLDREVAIKVLSPSVARDPDALARFEREATSVARLSHPNVLSIFEFVRDSEIAFVVMELVDGETLRDKLVTGPLAPRRAIDYAQQIARGIAAAHTRGIVHRDLKPENVMITRDGQVKILDFGLAKPLDTGGTEVTRGANLATSAGTVLGTFGYMAPEQVRGLPVDQRADMFAFGAVLYEMLTGERAFRGATVADTMTAVLTKEPPDLDLARLSIPAGLERIVRRCLEKAPEQRFQSANDLAFALESLSATSSASPAAAVQAIAAPSPARPSLLPWIVAAAAVLGAIAWSIWGARSAAPAAEGRWSSLTRITEAAGEETSPSLSPDGQTVIYAMRVNNSWDIYAQRVGGRNATPIVADPNRDEGSPAYSPDGSLIAFHEGDADGGIFVAGATGESVRRITSAGFDPAWSPDGKFIAYGTEAVHDPYSRLSLSTIYVVDAAGGTPREAVDGDGVQPSWSPSGDRLVYWSTTGGQRDLYTVAIAGGARVPLTGDAALDWSPIWSVDGRYIYFSSDRGGAMNVWRLLVDAASGRPQGQPEPVTVGVQSAGLPSFSKDGSRMAYRSRVASVNPVAIPFDPATLRAGTPVLLDTQNNIRIPSDVSPDGKQIAYFSIGERQEDAFVSALAGSIRRVTDDAPRDRAPKFTLDGRSLLFYSNRDGKWATWMIAVDGANLHKIAGPASGAIYPLLSPRGDTLVFISAEDTKAYSQPIAAGPAAAPMELAGAHVAGRAFQPTDWTRDGSRLIGQLVSESGRPDGVAVYEFATRSTTEVSTDEAYYMKWLGDGRRVVYFAKDGSELVVLDTVTRKRTVVDIRLPGRSASDTFAMAPDDRTIYYGAVRSEADIWIIEKK